MKALLLWLLLFACGGSLQAQDLGSETPVRCSRCTSLGQRPCGEHDKKACALERDALYCSLFAPCEACGGTGWVDCDRCENPAAEERLAARRAGRPARAEEVAHFARELGRPVPLLVTEHFELIFDVERAKVGRKVLQRHELLHLYGDRLEELYDAYVSLLGVEEEEFQKRSLIMVWGSARDHQEGARRYCRMAFSNGTRLLGPTPAYSVPALPEFFRDDEALHRNLVHNATHLLLSHQAPSHWIGQTKGGWADAGLAHYFEHVFFELCDTYCYSEQDTNRDFEGGSWRVKARKMVAAGEAPAFAGLFQQNTDTLSLDQHVAAFSLVDYLAQQDGEKLDELLRQLRRKVATRDALKAVFGVSPIALQEAWQEWALATYP